MFGHQDDKAKSDDSGNNGTAIDAAAAETVDRPDGSQATAPALGDDQADWQHPGPPPSDSATATSPDQLKDAVSPAGGFPKPLDYESFATGQTDESDDEKTDEESVKDILNSNDNDNELVGIKQQALNELLPLIDELDLPPEEKFRTIMMMIQASDNKDLVKKAYESAHEIKDEKVRAQALLDIVNEINYFTLPHEDAAKKED